MGAKQEGWSEQHGWNQLSQVRLAPITVNLDLLMMLTAIRSDACTSKFKSLDLVMC
jgi:hypothetical protein